MRKWIFETLQPGLVGKSRSCVVFDWILTVLIITSSVIVFAQTFDLPDRVLEILSVTEDVISIAFTVEYVLRIFTADLLYPGQRRGRAILRYVLSPMAIVDLLSILPFWLPMFLPGSFLGVRSLRLIRLLRILKLNRYFDAVHAVWNVLVAKKHELLGSLFFVGLLMLVASLLMYSVEHDAQPNAFRNAFSGLWWAAATLTTVGYGDLCPVTVMGRMLGVLIAFSGIAALAIPTGIITAGLTEELGRKRAMTAELARQRAKDQEHDAELARQRAKDAEHDRILAEQGRVLQEIHEMLSRQAKG